MRDVEAVLAAEGEEEVVAGDAGDVLRLEPEETPDAVILAGNYSSTDEFPIRNVTLNADTTYSVFLQANSGAMARLGFVAAATAAERTAKLSEVFAAKRALRIVDNEGRQHYGIISSVTSGATGTTPEIKLAATIPLQFKDATARLCGLKGLETGATANVVNFIRYDVRSQLANTAYSGLFSARSGLLGEDTRTELVRVEMDPSDPAGTALLGIGSAAALEELVAEYAVDLDFEPTVVNSALPAPDPTLGHVLSSDTSFSSYTGTGSLVQRIRAVRVRLSVRSREADRDANVPSGPDVASGLYRVLLGNQNGPRYARVRTLQADVQLANFSGVTW